MVARHCMFSILQGGEDINYLHIKILLFINLINLKLD